MAGEPQDLQKTIDALQKIADLPIYMDERHRLITLLNARMIAKKELERLRKIQQSE